MARGAHDAAVSEGDYSVSVSDFRSVFRSYCSFRAPFEVTGSCVNVLSCNFDGDHIYMSTKTTYSPSDICSTTSTSYGSSPTGSYGASSSGHHTSFLEVKAFYLVFFVLPCCLLKCLCKEDNDPPQTMVSSTSVLKASWSRCPHVSYSSPRMLRCLQLAPVVAPPITTPVPMLPAQAQMQVQLPPQMSLAAQPPMVVQAVQQSSVAPSAQLASPVLQTANPISSQKHSLSTFLIAQNLSQYETALRELGAVEVTDLCDLEQADCDRIGMKKLEAKRLQRAAGDAATMV